MPAGAALGQTFARFRLATQQTLLPTGGAIDGEVEDYMVNIEPTPGNILGFVYNDLDGDGVRDLDETGLEGWTIYIDANTNGQFDDGELSTVTAWDGSYEFIDLPPDTYVVRQVARGGWTQTGPAAGYYSIDVASNATVPDINFFNQDTVPPAVVSITRGDGIEPAGQRTNAETVKFVVQFSEPVNGVDLDDFDFEALGLPDVAIVSIDALDYHLYVVTVATGQGAGPLQLTLIDGDSIDELSPERLREWNALIVPHDADPPIDTLDRLARAWDEEGRPEDSARFFFADRAHPFDTPKAVAEALDAVARPRLKCDPPFIYLAQGVFERDGNLAVVLVNTWGDPWEGTVQLASDRAVSDAPWSVLNPRTGSMTRLEQTAGKAPLRLEPRETALLVIPRER